MIEKNLGEKECNPELNLSVMLKVVSQLQKEGLGTDEEIAKMDSTKLEAYAKFCWFVINKESNLDNYDKGQTEKLKSDFLSALSNAVRLIKIRQEAAADPARQDEWVLEVPKVKQEISNGPLRQKYATAYEEFMTWVD